MRWSLYRILAAVLLAASIALSVIIYQYDGFLHSVAATAAEGLLGLAGLYALALAILAWKPNVALPVAAFVGVVSFVAQAVNAATGPPNIAFIGGFWSYDFGFNAVAASSSCPYGCPPFRYSSLALFVLQVPLVVASARGYLLLRSLPAHSENAEGASEVGG